MSPPPQEYWPPVANSNNGGGTGAVTINDACSIFAGIVTFGSTLAVSTWTQQRWLGISTGTAAPLPTLAGLATVCVASLASHQAALSTQLYLTQGRRPTVYKVFELRKNADFGFRQDHLDLGGGLIKLPLHTLRICCVGLVAFKLLGGRYWAIAPSTYTHVGSFARVSLPATEQYATTTQRATIERLGRAAGCHTCGSRRLYRSGSFQFVGDHQPPKAVAEQMNARWMRRLFGRKVAFRFFPQCVDCSSIQGSLLSAATNQLRSSSFFTKRRSVNLQLAGGGANAYNHGLRPRLNHLAGGVLGAAAVVGASPADLIDGNLWRYANLHRRVDRWTRRQIKMARREIEKLLQ